MSPASTACAPGFPASSLQSCSASSGKSPLSRVAVSSPCSRRGGCLRAAPPPSPVDCEPRLLLLLLLLLLLFAGEDCLCPVRAGGVLSIPYMRCSRRNDSSLNLLAWESVQGGGVENQKLED